MPVRAELPVERRTLERAGFIALPDPDRPSEEQKRVGWEMWGGWT